MAEEINKETKFEVSKLVCWNDPKDGFVVYLITSTFNSGDMCLQLRLKKLPYEGSPAVSVKDLQLYKADLIAKRAELVDANDLVNKIYALQTHIDFLMKDISHDDPRMS